MRYLVYKRVLNNIPNDPILIFTSDKCNELIKLSDRIAQ